MYKRLISLLILKCLKDLTGLYQRIVEENNRLKMSALQGMGGVGAGVTAGQTQQQMLDYQNTMNQYQQLQQSLAQMIGSAGMNIYDMYNQPKGTGVTSPYIGMQYKPGITMK